MPEHVHILLWSIEGTEIGIILNQIRNSVTIQAVRQCLWAGCSYAKEGYLAQLPIKTSILVAGVTAETSGLQMIFM